MQKLLVILCESIHSSAQLTQNSGMQGKFTRNRFSFTSTLFASFSLWTCTFIYLIFEYWTGRRHIIVLVPNHPQTLVNSISWIVYYCIGNLKFNSIEFPSFLWRTWRKFSWFLCRFFQIPSFLIDSSQMGKVLWGFIKLETIWL